MKGNSLKEISLKHLKRKENIVFGLIITLLIIILFVLITIINFSINYKKENNQYNILARTFTVTGENKTKEELDSISNIPHVVVNVSEFYRNPFYQYAEDFDDGDMIGYLATKALILKDSLKIIDGRNIKSDNEMLIPTKFYPYGELNNGENKIHTDKMLNGKDLIGKTVTLYSDRNYPEKRPSMSNDEYNEIWEQWKANRQALTFTIVGTYDTAQQLEERNTVYVSMKAIDQLKNETRGAVAGLDADGTERFTVLYYTDRMITVDDYKNLESVQEKLNSLGFQYNTVFQYDDKVLALIIYLPLFISLIILIMTLILIKNFISKKFNNIRYELGLLKSLGFNNKHIIKIERDENLFITAICFISAFIIFTLTYIILKNTLPFFATAEFYSYTIKIPYIYLIMLSLFVLLYIFFLNKILINKHLKYNASELLKED